MFSPPCLLFHSLHVLHAASRDLPALSAFIRTARASFLLCLPFALRHAAFILTRHMFVFSFCFAYCPKHLRQYHFLRALSSLIAKIFFFFCFSYLQAPFSPPFLAVVPGVTLSTRLAPCITTTHRV